MMFQKAVKQQKKVAIAISGPSNSGKTYSALSIAKGFGDKVALYDTEGESSTLYSDKFDFDVCKAGDKSPNEIANVIRFAAKEGYDVLIIDSLTHAWKQTLDNVDLIAKGRANTFSAWKEGGKPWDALMELVHSLPIHCIFTMRAKTEYTQDRGDDGKTKVTKHGMAAQVRDGAEYEFDIMLEMNQEHVASIGKTRMSELDGKHIHCPGADLGRQIKDWATSGVKTYTMAELDAWASRAWAEWSKYVSDQAEKDARHALLSAAKKNGLAAYQREIELLEKN